MPMLLMLLMPPLLLIRALPSFQEREAVMLGVV